jgi:hypothetical protein
MNMQRRVVSSANLGSVGWQADENQDGFGTLEVEFRSGHIYRYPSVPEALYQALLGAASVGKYFNLHVKDQFDEERIA